MLPPANSGPGIPAPVESGVWAAIPSGITQNNWDFAILKNIRLYGERQHLQFRAEMFNLMNRVQFSMPAYVSVVDTGVAGWRLQPRFGEITSQYNSPRYMQMSLRYFF